jgi:hypothetical protein
MERRLEGLDNDDDPDADPAELSIKPKKSMLAIGAAVGTGFCCCCLSSSGKRCAPPRSLRPSRPKNCAYS